MTAALRKEAVAFFRRDLARPHEFDGLSPASLCRQGASLNPYSLGRRLDGRRRCDPFNRLKTPGERPASSAGADIGTRHLRGTAMVVGSWRPCVPQRALNSAMRSSATVRPLRDTGNVSWVSAAVLTLSFSTEPSLSFPSVGGSIENTARHPVGWQVLNRSGDNGGWSSICGVTPESSNMPKGRSRVAVAEPSALLCTSMARSLWPFCCTWSCESEQTLVCS